MGVAFSFCGAEMFSSVDFIDSAVHAVPRAEMAYETSPMFTLPLSFMIKKILSLFIIPVAAKAIQKNAALWLSL